MNQELLQFYIQGLQNGWFYPESNTNNRFPDHIEEVMRDLEDDLQRKCGTARRKNPEFQAALEMLESPLMKALA